MAVGWLNLWSLLCNLGYKCPWHCVVTLPYVCHLYKLLWCEIFVLQHLHCFSIPCHPCQISEYKSLVFTLLTVCWYLCHLHDLEHLALAALSVDLHLFLSQSLVVTLKGFRNYMLLPSALFIYIYCMLFHEAGHFMEFCKLYLLHICELLWLCQAWKEHLCPIFCIGIYDFCWCFVHLICVCYSQYLLFQGPLTCLASYHILFACLYIDILNCTE